MTGTNGVIVPPDGYLQSVREVCDRHGILLICDEVMAGFGRTGKWFACEHWDVVPDILTVAKGINSGYVPLGAMVVREPIADWVRDKYFAGGLTYAAIRSRARRRSRRSRRSARRASSRTPPRWATYGRGCASLPSATRRSARCAGSAASGARAGARTARRASRSSRSTRRGEAAAPVARLAKAALERGLYLMTHWNVVMVCPPLTITREELDEGLAILDEALAVADEFADG